MSEGKECGIYDWKREQLELDGDLSKGAPPFIENAGRGTDSTQGCRVSHI